MNPIDSKLKKILAMIDGATSEGEAKAAVPCTPAPPRREQHDPRGHRPYR